jgi:hypothetical protein
MTGSPSDHGTPRWVKAFGAVAALLALVVLFAVLTGVGGPHGSHHDPSRGHAADGPWGLLVLLAVLAAASIAFNWNWLAAYGFSPGWRQWKARAFHRRTLPTMTPRVRRVVLVAHIASSVGTLGAVAAFLALALAGLISSDAQAVRAAYIAMGLIVRGVIVPLVFASLLIGIVQSLASPWGLLRHYWVMAKLLLTILTIVVLLLQMEAIDQMERVATATAISGAEFLELRRSLGAHAAGGMLVLLALVVLSVYKPRGMTPYGRRALGASAPARSSEPDR